MGEPRHGVLKKVLATSRSLRKQCLQLAEELELPESFSAITFCQLLAATRQRPIILWPENIAPSWDRMTGLLLFSPRADHIVYDWRTSRYHQEHIILHEAAHIILGHHAPEVADDAMRPPNIAVLPRHQYSKAEEQRAEMLATMVLERGQHHRGQHHRRYQKFSDAVDPWY